MMSISFRLLLTLVALALAVGCTKRTTSGTYGPFEIGETREAAYDKVFALGVDYVTPRPDKKIQFNAPDMEKLQSLNTYDGIHVWINDEHYPLRIEFKNDVVFNTWPDFSDSPMSPSIPESIRSHTALMVEFQASIRAGTTRTETYEFILEMASKFKTRVGNHVPGERRFRDNPSQRWGMEYRELLLGADVWEFDGLEELVWFSPFYSRATLTFKHNRLAEVKHWAFPFESF